MDNARKKACELLHFARMEVQDIFEDLQGPGPIPGSGENAFKIAIYKLYHMSATFFTNWQRRKMSPLTSLWFD